jgi:hypothetical protein
MASVAGAVAPPIDAPVPNSVGRRYRAPGASGTSPRTRSMTPTTIAAICFGSGFGMTRYSALFCMRAMCLSMRKTLMLPSAQR